MSLHPARPYLSPRSLPWLFAGLSCALLVLAGAWSLAQHYPPLILVSLARVSGWLALLVLAVALCVSPVASLGARFMPSAHWPSRAPAVRRLTGMTSAWLAMVHAGLGGLQRHDPARGTLDWLVETAHLRAGLSALLILSVLLLTSFPASVRALRVRGWKELHRLAYVAFACAVQHGLLSPFAPRAWLLGVVSVTLLAGSLRLLPAKRSRPHKSKVQRP